MKTNLIRSFIESRRQPLNSSTAAAQQINELCLAAPKFCLKALGDERTEKSHKSQLLAGLIDASIEPSQIVSQLQSMPEGDLLHVLTGLQKRRLNRRRVRELGLATLLNHPKFAELAANHRQRLVRIFKHLLGERTWASVCRFLAATSEHGERFLAANLLRFADDASSVREAICFLAGLGFEQSEPARRAWLALPWTSAERRQVSYTSACLRQSVQARKDIQAGRGMRRETLSGIRGVYHRQFPKRALRELAAPSNRRQRADGPATAAIKKSLTDGATVTLDAVIDKVAVRQVVPALDVRAAVVLDQSASAASSGERAFHPAALGLALAGLLERHFRDVQVFQVGGSRALGGRDIPRPQGVTDLATAVLQAAKAAPEAMLIITDGYENMRQGDVAQVVAGMRRLGITTTVEQVTPVISVAEDLSRRRLGEAIPVVPTEHECAVGELAARLFLAGRGEQLDDEQVEAVERWLFAALSLEV